MGVDWMREQLEEIRRARAEVERAGREATQMEMNARAGMRMAAAEDLLKMGAFTRDDMAYLMAQEVECEVRE